jgi:hypothetical protein
VYTACWVAFTALSLGIAVGRRHELELWSRAYVRFLTAPWKLATFAVAWTSFTLIAPYTGDPTWDYVDATFMSALTFVTSPWALGVLVRVWRGRVPRWQCAPAAALWLFSSSWLYDAYVWARDGRYPATWASNLIASSVLYFCAGSLWSLEARPGRGVTFAFLESEWFAPRSNVRSVRLWVGIAFFAAFVAAMMSPFLLELWSRLGDG